MKQLKSFLILFALTFSLTGLAWAATFNIDTNHSQVGFKVRHLGISMVSGRFKKFSGSFDFDPNKIEASKVSVTIDAASIDTGVGQRDDHLRSADFLEVEKHPELRFVSKEIKGIQGRKFQIVGDLTIRGVTKSVALDTELTGIGKDARGNDRAGFQASTTINRKDFGLAWSRLVEGGGLVVADEVHIIIEVQGVHTKQPS